MSQRYRIEVEATLDVAWADWLGELSLSQTASGHTVLTGTVADQAALHGLLARIRDLGLPIRLVARLENSHLEPSGGDVDDDPTQTV